MIKQTWLLLSHLVWLWYEMGIRVARYISCLAMQVASFVCHSPGEDSKSALNTLQTLTSVLGKRITLHITEI